MRIYRNDIIKASAISTDDDRGLLLCSITDSGFTSIQKYCNKEQKTICLCNVSFFIFIEKSAGL